MHLAKLPLPDLDYWLFPLSLVQFWTLMCLMLPTACVVPIARSIRTVCTRRIQWSCEGLMSTSQQILWIQLNHLLRMTMYNLSLPKLHANYYGLPMTVQLQAAHELMFTVQCLAANWPQVNSPSPHHPITPGLNGILLGPFTILWPCKRLLLDSFHAWVILPNSSKWTKIWKQTRLKNLCTNLLVALMKSV